MNPLIVFLALFSVCSASDATQFENKLLIESYTTLADLFKKFSMESFKSASDVNDKHMTLIEWTNEVMESIATTLSPEGVLEVESSVEELKDVKDNLLKSEKNLSANVVSSTCFSTDIIEQYNLEIFKEVILDTRKKSDFYLEQLRSVRKQIGLFQSKVDLITS